MCSKLISLLPHESQNPLELSLRQSYDFLQHKLRPPLKYMIIKSHEEYLEFNRAIIYGVLCAPNLAKVHIKYLHAIVNDGYCLFIKLLVQVVDGLYTKLLEVARVQLVWVVSVMVDVAGVGLESVFVSILRQVVGGDFSDGNLWLSYEVVNLLSVKWDLVLDEEPGVLVCGLYKYLRLLGDHYRLARTPRSTELKRKEIGFCVRMLREQFGLCLRVGRDLVLLLQDLVHIPDFRVVWKDLVLNPSSFGVAGFSGVSDIYGMRTSSRYILLRITPEMETQLRFLLTYVKFGFQKRHQTWFARKFLFAPERETLIADMVRFICCAHHPSNEVLQSDVIPRWAVIGWLLKSCTKKYIEASVKLTLFYDWLFFDEKVDNVMNIEPAMLLMVNSIPRYVDMTHSLLEFLLLLVENYDTDSKNAILKGVSSAINMLVKSGVINSIDILTSSNSVSPFIKDMLQTFMLRVKSDVLQEPQLPDMPKSDVPSLSLPNTSDMEIQTDLSAASPVNVELHNQQKSVPELVDSAPELGLSCVNNEHQVDDAMNLIGKITDSMKNSNKMGRQVVENILLLCVSRDTHEKLGNFSSEALACAIKKELELAGYKLFSPLESFPNSDDVDDEVQSVTAAIIRIFTYSQHQLIREMLSCWLRNGCLVGSRLLSYALRLAYEGGFESSFTAEIDCNKMPHLLKFHIKGYLTFKSMNLEGLDATIASAVNVNKELISKMIDDAFTSYQSIMLAHSKDALSKELNMTPGKLISIDVMSCSLWKSKAFKFLFHGIFSYLSDLSVGNENLIMLLVSHLEHADLVSIQIDVGLKKYAIFGGDVHNVLQVIRRSVCWKQIDQHKFWGLVRSELTVSGFPVEKLLLYCFFSEDLDPMVSGIAIEGLMTLCCCHAPTPEIVGAVMLLPNNKFPDYAATILSHWAITNASMLWYSVSDFFNKLVHKNGTVPLDWDGIVINQSALLYLLNYLETQSETGNSMLGKLALILSDIRTRLGTATVAMDTG